MGSLMASDEMLNCWDDHWQMILADWQNMYQHDFESVNKQSGTCTR